MVADHEVVRLTVANGHVEVSEGQRDSADAIVIGSLEAWVQALGSGDRSARSKYTVGVASPKRCLRR